MERSENQFSKIHEVKESFKIDANKIQLFAKINKELELVLEVPKKQSGV